MKYKCKKRLVLDRYNDDELEEYSDFVVEIGEVYEKKNVRLMIASDHKRAIHLEDDNRGRGMSKAVLISIHPEWCELIASGAKTVEVRKTKPKIEKPFKCYIYCTKGKTLLKTASNGLFIDLEYKQGENLYGLYEVANGKIVGEFVCDRISPIAATYDGLVDVVDLQESCMTVKEMLAYSGGKLPLYGWHISDLVIYDRPREITNFYEHCDEDYDCWLCKWWGRETATCKMPPITRPPQSWRYVEEKEEARK